MFKKKGQQNKNTGLHFLLLNPVKMIIYGAKE